METNVERIDEQHVKMTVTVSAAEVDEVIGSVYTEAAKSVRIPGFRKGKAPRPVLDNHLGRDAILSDAQEEIISTYYARALSDNDIRPIESPDTGEVDAVVAGEPYTFTAEILTRPELKLSSADDFTVTVEPAKSSDREIDAQIAYSRDRFATLDTVDKAIEADDFALVSFVGTIDGEEYEGNSVDMYLYELNKGLMPPEFDTAMIGHKAGDEVVATFDVPDTSSNPDFVGKQARFVITISEVKAKVLPELDDEFAMNVGGFETFEAYREDIRKTLDESKAAGHMRKIEDAARAALAERVEGDVPESMVRSRANNMVEDFFENLEQRGMSVEQYMEMTGVDAGKIRADIEVEAERRLRTDMGLEALFSAKGMDISEADLEESIREIAGGQVDAGERMRSQLRDAGALPVVKEQIMHRKALRWLIDNVEVIESDPAQDDEAPKPAKKAVGKKKSAKSEEE
ncbi:MAG: trigger factor [Coriobacteriia bacterium]|nr:trigger factor [Coriobacteriia bacterium]MBN2822042.1 trigger factor [Coriobacteriia bacterium]